MSIKKSWEGGGRKKGDASKDGEKNGEVSGRRDSDIFSSSNSRHKFLHYVDGSRMPSRAIPLAGKQTLKRRLCVIDDAITFRMERRVPSIDYRHRCDYQDRQD